MRSAVERISQWMNDNDAPLLVENLAAGATEKDLAHAEATFGITLPADLRALWSLHNGQIDEGNGFIEAFDFLSISRSIEQQETVLGCIEFEREAPELWQGTPEELQSDYWIPFAGQDSDSLVVHAVTGRVFCCYHDDSAEVIAESLGDWFEAYAARVEADDYKVEDGFGDYYLELRDREAEAREKERKERAAEHDRMRHQVPLLEQFREAIETKNDDRATEVLNDARERNDRAAFAGAVALLFAGNVTPTFIASTLRTMLNVATLTPDQWVDVAVGGALLTNNAIRDIAIARAKGLSAARLRKLEDALATSSETERAALNVVFEKLRA